jgi:hypothetical protein
MGRFFEWLFGKHTRECGAVYKVTGMKLPSPDTDDVCCQVCGKVMDSWQHSALVRSYDLVSRTNE